MTRHLLYLCILAIPAYAKEPAAQQVLDKVVSTYTNLTAVHMVAEREDTTYSAGGPQTASSECELANAAGGRYIARLKQPGQQALAVNDGSDIWLALDSKKQWSRVSASPTDDSDEEHDARAASENLHDSLQNIVIGRLLALVKSVQDPVMAKPQVFDLAGRKAPCYAIRAHTPGADVELLVDKEKFVVFEYTEKSSSAGKQVAIAMKLKLVELNQEVAASLFHFSPEPGWTEVEAPVPTSDPVRTGEPAREFALKTLDGESVALQNLRGSVVVLDFWATWCLPCREEFPALEKIRSEFAGDVRFYGISDESPALVKQFVDEYRYRMPMLLDTRREMRRRYGIHKIPELLVIDRDSVVRRLFIGVQDESELREAIRSVVDRKPPNQQ